MPSAALSDKAKVGLARNITALAVNFVLPLRCAGCGDIVSAEGGFCLGCWDQLHFLGPPCCDKCGVPLPFESDVAQSCGACLAKPPRHDGIRAAVAYSDISRDIALRLKYAGKIGHAQLIAKQLLRHLPPDRQDWLLVPVPLHWTRLWARSFNQSALIARALSQLGGVNHAPDMLRRTRRTELLRGKSGKQRRKEVSQAFAVHRRQVERVKNANIILVDDVYTTGATSDACVKALKRAGAAQVQIFCWARVLREEQEGAPISASTSDNMAPSHLPPPRSLPPPPPHSPPSPPSAPANMP